MEKITKYQKRIDNSESLKNYLRISKESFSFPMHLNIFISNFCNYRCSFPYSKKLWCHSCEEYHDKNFLKYENIRPILQQFRKELSIKSIKIAGMEPSLHPNLPEFIENFNDLGFKDISLTSNGSNLGNTIPRLVDSGLKKLTISIHSFNKRIYSKITGGGNIDKILKVISLSLDYGLKISINRVLLKGINDNIKDFFEFCEKWGITAKLYQLLWHPRIDEQKFREYYINPWQLLEEKKIFGIKLN